MEQQEQKQPEVAKPVQKFKNWTMQSSQIKTTEYNEEKQEMIVVFGNGGRYSYAGVPLDVWKLSLITSSIGKFINSTIKKYPVTKLN